MCCALHNLLLVEDGLDERWDGEEFDADEYADMPLRRLQQMDEAALLAAQQAMFGDDADLRDTNQQVDAVEVEPSYDEFRAALIEHFNYRWKLPAGHPDSIKWPRRNTSADAFVNAHHDNE